MAKSDGSVIIDTRMDTKGFGKGVNTIQKQIGCLGGAIGKLGKVIAAAFAIKKLVQFGKEAIDLGSDLQEVQNVVDVTFSTMNEAVNEFARNAAETAGLSETMAKRYTGTFGAMAKAFGFAENEAFDMSTSLTQLAGDVASFYNLTQDEAYTKLKSVFTGETESLKDLGVVMTQTALDSFAMAKGYGKTTKQMSEQEKVALRYAFVLEQLNSASGDFVRTQDSWANQTRIMSLNFDSFKANIGQALINIFTPLLKVINMIVSKMAQASQYFVAFSEMIVGKQTSGGGGSPGGVLSEISAGYDDVAESTKDAVKEQKKYLSGLDEIRTFTEDSSVADTGPIAGIGSINSIDTEIAVDASGINNLSNIFENLKNKVSELSERFPILKNTIGIAKGAFDLISKSASDLFALLTKPITDNKDGLILAAKNIGEFLIGIWEDVTAGVDRFVQKLNSVYDQSIAPFFATLTEDISGFVNKFLNWFNTDMSDVLDRWGEKCSALWSNHLSPFLDNLAEFFGEIVDNIKFLWQKYVTPFVNYFLDDVLPAITPAIEYIGNLAFTLVGTIADVASGIMDILSGLITFIIGLFAKDWKRAWMGLKDVFVVIINACAGIIEGFVNTIIDQINYMIAGINNISSKIGIPAIPEIRNLNIPALATGAVIPPNAPFMAVLGDQKHGTNIEAPLDTIKQAVREVMGSGKGGSYQFTAQINRRTLFEEMIDEARLRQSTSGHNPFDLV